VYTVKYIILINIIIYLLLLQDYNSLLKDFQCELMCTVTTTTTNVRIIVTLHKVFFINVENCWLY